MEGASVGLVLGAGGTPGGAFIRAALAELKARTGWDPDAALEILGTSVGALNAARLASHPGTARVTQEQYEALANMVDGLPAPKVNLLDRVVVRPARRLGGKLLARFGPQGTSRADYDVATGPFRRNVRVVSVAKRDGRRRVAELHAATSPTEELYASAAIPGFAIPRTIGGRKFVDGAVWSTTNADLADLERLDLLIVIAPMVPRAGGSLIQRSHRALLAAELAPWQKAQKPALAILPPAGSIEGRDDIKLFAAAARRQVMEAAGKGAKGPSSGEIAVEGEAPVSPVARQAESAP